MLVKRNTWSLSGGGAGDGRLNRRGVAGGARRSPLRPRRHLIEREDAPALGDARQEDPGSRRRERRVAELDGRGVQARDVEAAPLRAALRAATAMVRLRTPSSDPGVGAPSR